MSVLTPEQLERLKEIIEDASKALAVIAVDHQLTTKEIDRLVSEGYLTKEEVNSIIEGAYKHGAILARLAEAGNMTAEQFKRHLKANPLAMSRVEKLAFDNARDRAGTFCVGLGNRWSEKLGGVVVNADAELARQMREDIESTTAAAIARRKTVGGLRSDLKQLTQDWSRDWDRIAQTEVQQAHQEGYLEKTIAEYGPDELLAKVPEPDACKHCVKHYTKNGAPIIKPASWWAQHGANNFGRKTQDWQPVLGTMHPWCRCRLQRVPKGWGITMDGELVPPGVEKSVANRGDQLFKARLRAKVISGQMGLFGGGPVYLGPRGGKYADPQRTIPYKEHAATVPELDDGYTGGLLSPDMSIESAEDSIRRASVEHLAIYYGDKMERRYKGQKHQVDLGAKECEKIRKHGNATVIHNHPSGSILSATDLYLALTNNIKEIRAVAPNGVVWSLKRPSEENWLDNPLSAVPGATSLADALDSIKRDADYASTRRMDQHMADNGGKPGDSSHPSFSMERWIEICDEETEKAFNRFLEPSGARIEKIPPRPAKAHPIRPRRRASGVRARGQALAAEHLSKSAHSLQGRRKWHDLDVSIENRKGGRRYWKDENDGSEGSTKMHYAYGYIRRTLGPDGDHVDVYMGPDQTATKVYVIHQLKAPEFKDYDEDKCMLDFPSKDAAIKAYLRQYNDKRFLGSVTTMSVQEFKVKVLATRSKPAKRRMLKALVERGQELMRKSLAGISLPEYMAPNRSVGSGSHGFHQDDRKRRKKTKRGASIVIEQMNYMERFKELMAEFEGRSPRVVVNWRLLDPTLFDAMGGHPGVYHKDPWQTVQKEHLSRNVKDNRERLDNAIEDRGKAQEAARDTARWSPDIEAD